MKDRVRVHFPPEEGKKEISREKKERRNLFYVLIQKKGRRVSR